MYSCSDFVDEGAKAQRVRTLLGDLDEILVWFLLVGLVCEAKSERTRYSQESKAGVWSSQNSDQKMLCGSSLA